MRSRYRAALTVLLPWILVSPLLFSSTAAAQTGGGANNVVQVVSTADMAFKARAHVQVVPFGGDSANSTNLALAQSRDCTGCTGRAAAFQAVFLTGSPSTVAPTNAASAVNSNCDGCTSFAYACQVVVTAERGFALSPGGRQAISDLGRQADGLVAERTDPVTLDGQLRALCDRFGGVVRDEVAASGASATTRTSQDRRTS